MNRRHDKQEGPASPEGNSRLYRLLAAGRYAASWLPELIVLYDLVRAEEGEEAASNWLKNELLHTLKPALAMRLYIVMKLLHVGLKMYRRLVRE